MPPLNVIDICDLCTVNPKAPSYLLINKKGNLLAIREKNQCKCRKYDDDDDIS